MKKFKLLFFAVLFLSVYSCSDELILEDEVTTNQIITENAKKNEENAWTNYIVDSNTPKNSQPYIAEGEYVSKEGRSAAQWNLTWSDEFYGSNYSNPSLYAWTEQYSSSTRGLNGRSPSLTWWGWRPEQTFIYGNNLILQTEKTASNVLLCGSANTGGKLSFLYGWFEARIGIQSPEYGSHTAFWLQSSNQVSGAGGNNGTASDGAEIDIFESVYTNTRVGSVVHYDGYGSHHKTKTLYWFAPGQNGNSYHNYALHWWPSGMDVYYDGVLKASFTGNHVSNTYEYVWLSNGAAFDYNHPSSGARLFAQRGVGTKYWTWVDYVRVWQYY